MRVIKIVLFSLLALSLIACTGIFIFFETFDTDQYLPKLTQKASIALGRPVSIGHLGLGFSLQGITLDAGPVTVSDDTAFTTQPFIKVDRVRISLDVRSLILLREIHIRDILLQSPQIHFIRSQEGNINTHSIGQASQPIGDKAVVMENRDVSLFRSKDPQTEIGRRPYFNNGTIRSIRVQDAAISFIDQSETNPLDIWLLNINLNLKDFSLSKPFRLSFDTSPLLRKGIASGDPDSPILKNIAGNVQLNIASLEANGDISTTGGVIKNFNIIKTLLSHTLGAFGHMDSIIGKLGTDDTVIDTVRVQFSIHDKTLFIDDSSIETDIFELTAKGSVDQGLSLDMQTMLHLNTDVSAAVVNEFEGAKFLMDDSQRIAIGASLKGVIPHLKYKPNKDFRKKSRKALMEEGGNILGALFGDR